MVDFKRVGDRITLKKIVLGVHVITIISAYAPLLGFHEED